MEAPIYHLSAVIKTRAEDLEDFVGPMDLILHLLSKNKVEIRDIQISLLLDQYLSWMDRRKQLDLEIASEFVTMAAHLVYIKTRMLLSLEDAEALSEMEALIASLEAHQRHESYHRIKMVAEKLEDRFAIGRDYLVKAAEPIPAVTTYRYLHRPEELLAALEQVRAKVGFQMPPPITAFDGIVGREPYPVGDKATEILRRLLILGVARFRALFKGSRNRSEIVATFIAVLELCKARRLRLAGTELDCTVTSTGDEETLPAFSTDVE